MKQITVTISDEIYAQLEQAALVLEMPLEEFASDSVETWVNQLSDQIGDLEVSTRIFDTLEELKRVAEKASVHDARHYSWSFYETPDGKFRAEYDHDFYLDRIKEGCVEVS